MKSFGVKALIIVLVVMNLLLCYEICRIKSDSSPVLVDAAMYTGRPTIPLGVVVSDRNDMKLEMRKLLAPDKPTMFVFFSTSDCPNCFSEQKLWAKANATGKAHFVGIAVSASRLEFWNWAASMEVSIPLYIDTTFSIFDSMKFEITPLKVLVNGKGKVLWADPPRLSKVEQKAFWRDFNHALEEYFQE